MKIIKVFIALIGVTLVSPIIKYQPDVINEIQTQDENTETITISETEVQETSGSDAESAAAKTETAEEASTEADIPGSDEKNKEVVSKTEPFSENTEGEVTVEKSADKVAETEIINTAATEESVKESEPTSVSPKETEFTGASAVYEYQDPETIPEPSTVQAHTWSPIREVIHHEATYQTIHHEPVTETVWVEDKPAWDEPYENTYLVAMHAICKGCGIDLNEAGKTDEELTAHDLQHILNGEDSSYYEAPIYQTVTETVHHEAEGHYEEQVVQEAYDETVLVSEAWDEEVVTGHICAGCGEVQ